MCRFKPVYGDRINATIKVQRIKTVRSGENRKGSIIRLLSSEALKSCKCGTGYRSGAVFLYKARESPHGLQSPGVCLGAMCKADDQLLDEG